jgi:hypothetical protein
MGLRKWPNRTLCGKQYAELLRVSVDSPCRRHLALLRSLASDGQSIVPVHTILEVVRVSPAMELLRVLPSAEDEVNAAAFHPLPVRAADGLCPFCLWCSGFGALGLAPCMPTLQLEGPAPCSMNLQERPAVCLPVRGRFLRDACPPD